MKFRVVYTLGGGKPLARIIEAVDGPAAVSEMTTFLQNTPMRSFKVNSFEIYNEPCPRDSNPFEACTCAPKADPSDAFDIEALETAEALTFEAMEEAERAVNQAKQNFEAAKTALRIALRNQDVLGDAFNKAHEALERANLAIQDAALEKDATEDKVNRALAL